MKKVLSPSSAKVMAVRLEPKAARPGSERRGGDMPDREDSEAAALDTSTVNTEDLG
jgi:hypothetical protein